jgi:hypothetical protein
MPSQLRKPTFYFLLIATLIIVSCARQPDPSRQLSPDELGFTGQLAGFIVGLFHGLTIVFNMIASLFFDVRIYTFPNSGRLYDLGFVLGASAALGGGARAVQTDRTAKKAAPPSESSISATCPSCGHRWLIRPSGSRLPL